LDNVWFARQHQRAVVGLDNAAKPQALTVPGQFRVYPFAQCAFLFFRHGHLFTRFVYFASTQKQGA
jgi:hypothetical protein